MERLTRKIDGFLAEWHDQEHRLPLIVKGARQIGKTEAIRHFSQKTYRSVVEINFILQKEYQTIFDDGFEVDTILRNISLYNPDFEFPAGETLIFFDELQGCVNCATSLKAFAEDGRFDVICSGSLMGINYNEIESNSVGYKEDYDMYSLDFEEFLWAKGYRAEQIEEMYQKMLSVTPLSSTEYDVMLENFREYMVLGGMPAVLYSRKTTAGPSSCSVSFFWTMKRTSRNMPPVWTRREFWMCFARSRFSSGRRTRSFRYPRSAAGLGTGNTSAR